MPNRILKESICTSESIDTLTAFQETFFYRLIVNCDDFGRFDARPKILKSRLFPLKDDVRDKQIEDALRALSSAELVTLYIVDGKPFLQMKTWNRHQPRARADKSKYPEPTDENAAPADVEQLHSTCNADAEQVQANDAVIRYSLFDNRNTIYDSTDEKRASAKRASRFTPPSVDEVKAYCSEQGYRVDAERFVAYYESNGWKVGKNPMKDWQAAVRTWVRNDQTGQKTAQKPVAMQFEQRDYTGVDFSALNADLSKYK